MMSVLINGRIKNKKKVEDFVYNTLFDLMPRLKRTVYIDIDVVQGTPLSYTYIATGDEFEEIYPGLHLATDGHSLLSWICLN